MLINLAVSMICLLQQSDADVSTVTTFHFGGDEREAVKSFDRLCQKGKIEWIPETESDSKPKPKYSLSNAELSKFFDAMQHNGFRLMVSGKARALEDDPRFRLSPDAKNLTRVVNLNGLHCYALVVADGLESFAKLIQNSNSKPDVGKAVTEGYVLARRFYATVNNAGVHHMFADRDDYRAIVKPYSITPSASEIADEKAVQIELFQSTASKLRLLATSRLN